MQNGRRQKGNNFQNIAFKIHQKIQGIAKVS